MSYDRDHFIRQLSILSVGELVELKRQLEQAWGVSLATPDVPERIEPPVPPPPEPTEYTVVLKGAGANKIAVIRAVRELMALGLVAARDLVDAAPKEVGNGLSKADAEVMASRLTAAGAEVEVK
jgi:large subunit ribosomal protein L7/L12